MIEQALVYGIEELANTSSSAKIDASCLLCFCLNTTREMLLAWPDRSLTSGQWHTFKSYVARRKTGEPIAYICKQKAFWTLNLMVTPDTLIPRPETELLIELISAQKNIETILDLGTGSGAIAIALAQEFPDAKIIATDKSAKALLVANINAKKYNLTNTHFILSDWFCSLPITQTFDIIVSNPPYIAPTDIHLKQGDVRFEPLSALVADQGGLADLRAIINNAIYYLGSNGCLFLEHGYNQHLSVQEMMDKQGYKNIETFRDFGGNTRVTKGLVF